MSICDVFFLLLFFHLCWICYRGDGNDFCREVSLSFLYEPSEFTDIFQRNYGPFLVLGLDHLVVSNYDVDLHVLMDSHRVLENKTE